MPEYTYSPPETSAEASARIDHWMGDVNDFQQKLGRQPAGYYPRFSGKDFDHDAWAIYDNLLHPETPAEAPVPSLRYAWLNTLVRTRDDLTLKIKTATDLDKVKSRITSKLVVVKKAAYEKFFGWLLR